MEARYHLRFALIMVSRHKPGQMMLDSGGQDRLEEKGVFEKEDTMSNYIFDNAAQQASQRFASLETLLDPFALIAALQRCEFDLSRLRNSLAGVHDFPGVTGKTTFLPNGDVKKDVFVKKLTGSATSEMLARFSAQ